MQNNLQQIINKHKREVKSIQFDLYFLDNEADKKAILSAIYDDQDSAIYTEWISHKESRLFVKEAINEILEYIEDDNKQDWHDESLRVLRMFDDLGVTIINNFN